jgi:hypothetical protein
MLAILRPFSTYQLLRLTDSQVALSVIFSNKSTITKNKLERLPGGRWSQKAITAFSPAFPG